MEIEPIDKREPVSTNDFFLRLRQLYPINLIYYPGSGRDGKLFGAFQESEVVLLDDELLHDRDLSVEGPWIRKNSYLYSSMQYKPFVFADYNHAPFRDEVFDAVFINCNYTDEEGFSDMLRTLKVGGLVIFGDVFLNDFADEDLDRLEDVELSFSNMNAGRFNPWLVAKKTR